MNVRLVMVAANMNVTNVTSMKYINSYKVFESHYNKEEFIDVVCRELSKYQITPLEVKTLLQKYDNQITQSLESGINPQDFSKQIISDLELDNTGGALSVNFNKPNVPEIKYL